MVLAMVFLYILYLFQFQDGYYWVFDERRLDVVTYYKRRVRDKWPLYGARFDAAMTYNEYHQLFFSGDK